MNKSEFLSELGKALGCLPEQDREGILGYYGEIIEDKIEAGQDEASAVLSVGSVEEIVNQVLADGVERPENADEPQKRRKIDKRQLIILIAGSPLWIPLLLAAATIIFAAYICAWASVFSVAVTEAALVLSAPAAALMAIVTVCMGDVALGIMVLGICISASGIALIAFLPCIKLIVYSAKLTKKSVLNLVKLATGGKL